MTEHKPSLYSATVELPQHLRGWQLPPGWSWGTDGLMTEHRHYQEVIDALGRSLSLVSAPDPAHHPWLEAEARQLAHRNHPAMPTTYHYWASFSDSRRGPGYLRRWIAGETVAARLRRMGTDDVPGVMRVLRETGSALSYLHDLGATHGAMSPETVWTTPMGRLWIIGWQWALPAAEIPDGLVPDFRFMPIPERVGIGRLDADAAHRPVAARGDLLRDAHRRTAAAVRGAAAPADATRRDAVGAHGDRSRAAPGSRAPVSHHRGDAARGGPRRRQPHDGHALGRRAESAASGESAEVRLRWALADDYEVLAALGSGSFGSVWRVRDLTLGREVALKLLHPHVARDERIVGRFRREAKLAAQLAHPAIVPIFDWDSRGDVAWYTMELAESGSVADLVARSGPRT